MTGEAGQTSSMRRDKAWRFWFAREESRTRRRTRSSSTLPDDDIERDDLVYSVNEPDNYAVEEALQIADRTGGTVTVVTVGGDEDEEILRREMAMGAKQAALLSDEAFAGSDGRGIAAILKAFVQTGALRPDSDRGAGRRRRGAGGRHAGGDAGLSVRVAGDLDRSAGRRN